MQPFTDATPALTVCDEGFKIKSFTPSEGYELRPARRQGEGIALATDEQKTQNA